MQIVGWLIDPEQVRDEDSAISAAMQRRLADQLEWVNITIYPYFEAYQFFDTTWLEQ